MGKEAELPFWFLNIIQVGEGGVVRERKKDESILRSFSEICRELSFCSRTTICV